MKILITGSAGFIGFSFSRYLAKNIRDMKLFVLIILILFIQRNINLKGLQN